jgi:hypothetical protein
MDHSAAELRNEKAGREHEERAAEERLGQKAGHAMRSTVAAST